MSDTNSKTASRDGDAARIYVDVDDVLSETATSLLELLKRRFDVTVSLGDLTSFELETCLGLAEPEFERFIEEAHEAKVLESMDVVPGAAECLAHWHAIGCRIEIVTGRPPETAGPTRRWLEWAGLVHHDFACVDKYGRHHHHPERIPIEVLIDSRFRLAVEDSPGIATFLAERGIADEVALLDRPWNRELPELRSDAARERLVRVTDWEEIRRRWPEP